METIITSIKDFDALAKAVRSGYLSLSVSDLASTEEIGFYNATSQLISDNYKLLLHTRSHDPRQLRDFFEGLTKEKRESVPIPKLELVVDGHLRVILEDVAAARKNGPC